LGQSIRKAFDRQVADDPGGVAGERAVGRCAFLNLSGPRGRPHRDIAIPHNAAVGPERARLQSLPNHKGTGEKHFHTADRRSRSRCTRSRLMSDGVTPGMRPAWPMESGRMDLSF